MRRRIFGKRNRQKNCVWNADHIQAGRRKDKDMKRRKIVALGLMGALTISALTGCNTGSLNETSSAESAGGDAQSAQESGKSQNLEAVPGESIMTNGGEVIALSSLEHQDAEADAEVFYTSDISSEAMTEIYNALGQQLTGENFWKRIGSATISPAEISLRATRGSFSAGVSSCREILKPGGVRRF